MHAFAPSPSILNSPEWFGGFHTPRAASLAARGSVLNLVIGRSACATLGIVPTCCA
jgi:hypothetical protein